MVVFIFGWIALWYSGTLLAKSVYGTEIDLVAFTGTSEICGDNYAFWKMAQASTSKDIHVLSCYLDSKIVDSNKLPDGFEFFSIGIPKILIQVNLTLADFQQRIAANKEMLKSFYQDNDSKEQQAASDINRTKKVIANEIQAIDYKKMVFIEEAENRQSWIQFSSYMIDNQSQDIMLFKAFILLKKKMIFLSINSVEGETQDELAEKGTQWIRMLIDKNS